MQTSRLGKTVTLVSKTSYGGGPPVCVVTSNDPHMDMTALSLAQLHNVVENHERQRAFDRPDYVAALDEIQFRQGPHLKIDTTVKCILDAAKERKFVSYGDLAKANGCAWQTVRRQMPRHLDLVLGKARARRAPLITAIVVNDINRATGDLEDSSLAGFVAGAERLGIFVTDAKAFLRQQQAATFEFAAMSRTL